MKLTKWLLLAMPALALTAFNYSKHRLTPDNPRTVFFDKTGMDTTVSPGEDFYRYANGNWLKRTTIPASEKHWGTMSMLADNNLKRLHTMLEDLAANKNAPNSNEQKVGDLYKSGMDTVTIEMLGYTPLKPLLAKIAAVKSYKELVQVAADGFKTDNGLLFHFNVAPDDKNSKRNVAHFDQTDGGLPTRDYYFKTDSTSVKIRNQYLGYIAKLFTLYGIDPATAEQKAQGILKLETDLARASLSPADLRDPVKNYNKFAVADVQKLMPDVDVKDAFRRMGIKADTVLVGQPGYYKTLDSLLKAAPITVWKDLATFYELNNAAVFLSKNFRDASFDFNDRLLSGRKQQKPRWKTMTAVVDAGLGIDNGLGELLGQVYVNKYFSPKAKQQVLNLINNLQNVYRERMKNLDWMSAETKTQAIAKLNAITKLIAYPDKWKNYDDVIINPKTFYVNEQIIANHNYKEMLAKLDKPVDKTEFQMTPATVGAYYNFWYNKIVFSAGILEFPFFDEHADDAVNYGGIGTVISHELTHGFDDQGRQYDKDGNLKDWWQPQDVMKFNNRVRVVVNQYNGFNIFDTHINGELTQGENLADIGGLSLAYEAFKRTPQGKSNVKIDGLTPDQRFFLSYAQIWRDKTTDTYLRARIGYDPHSPPMFRVNGPVSNNPAFYKAFNIKPGDKMYRPDSLRVKVW